MKFTKLTTTLSAVALALSLAACGPKDADVQTAANTAVSSMPGISVSVVNGVATMTGQFANDAARSTAEASVKAVNGVKSLVDSGTIAPPPPPPVVISPDDSIKMAVASAIKDYPTVTVDVKDGVVTLNGEVKKADLPKLMQAVSAMHPKKVENKAKITK
jgi:hyperosmotically inducible protein